MSWREVLVGILLIAVLTALHTFGVMGCQSLSMDIVSGGFR